MSFRIVAFSTAGLIALASERGGGPTGGVGTISLAAFAAAGGGVTGGVGAMGFRIVAFAAAGNLALATELRPVAFALS